MRSTALVVLVLLGFGSTGTSRGSGRLQTVPRPATRLHGELRGTNLQDRVRPVHEIVPAKIARSLDL